MALRQAIKISRSLIHHKHKLQPRICPLSTKPSKILQLNPFCSKNASSYSNNATPKVKKISKNTTDHIKEQVVQNQNITLEPTLEPVLEETVKKEFIKSSTQNAITMPLKIPRLANPFPEPVKCQQSHTVSDAEKARIMMEEVKMETKYGLFHQQPTIIRQNFKQIDNAEETPRERSRPDFTQKNSRRSQSCDQISYKPGRQPNYRRAKNYEELEEEKQSCTQSQDQSTESQKSYQKIATEQNENDCENSDEPKREGRRKNKTRAPRYLRNFWKSKKQQTRKYSTSSKYFQNDPNVMSEVEQCEKILERIKALYPESYGHLKKPFCIPGSPEEQAFIKNTLLISRRTNERHEIEMKRETAPVPSYSEVKTLTREPKTQLDSIYNLRNNNSDDTSRNYSTSNNRFGTNNDPYNFLERIKLSESLDHSDYNKLSDLEERNNNENRMFAPYPSYSECRENPEDLEEEVMECEANHREAQYEEDKTHYRKHDIFANKRSKDDIKNRNYSTYTTTNQQTIIDNSCSKQKYSTFFKQKPQERTNNFCSNMSSLNNKKIVSNRFNSNAEKNIEIEFIKKKAPCQNPYPDLPVCDYEKARKIRDDKRKNRKKNSDKKKKCTDKETDEEIPEAGSEISKEKTKNVITRIRKWLSSWRPESENIRVSKFYTDIDGRDTYIIQIDEYEDIKRQRKETMEFKPEEEITSHNVPDFMEEEIVAKKCEQEQAQQPDEIQPKTIAKEKKIDQTVPPTAVINKINKIAKLNESETFRIKKKEFIPVPLKNSYMSSTAFNNLIDVPVEENNSTLYLDKQQKKNPCGKNIKKKEPKKKKCRQEIKKKLPSCDDVQDKLDSRTESMLPLATKNTRPRTQQFLKKFNFTNSSSKKQPNIDIKPHEIGNIHHEMTENKTKNREMAFKLKQEFWK